MKGRRYFAFGYDKGVAMNPQGDLSGNPSDVSAVFIYSSSDERDYDVMCNPYGEDRLILYKVGENQGRRLLMDKMNSLARHGVDVGDCSHLGLYDLVYRWKKANEGTDYGRVEERDLKKDGFGFPGWWKVPYESLVGRFVSIAYKGWRNGKRVIGQVKDDGTVGGCKVFDMTRKRACLCDNDIDVEIVGM